MTDAKQCTACQAELPPDAPLGLCPRCLLVHESSTVRAAVAAEPDQPVGRSFTAPAPAELASHFPQLELLELLGQGGMGAVYMARQRGLDRLVALKILPPEAGRDPAFAERFNREARALGKLNHPNIVTVYDFGNADGLYYFVMEYVDGLNLRQLLRAGHLQPQQALKIVPQICDALQFAHEEGIVHRDIKPENILLDRKGRVKIADFGIAKLLGGKPAEYTLTGPWQVVGTVHYMAPEQVERPQEVDHRADIYSLGVVFYELLTGQLPLGRFTPPSKKVQVDVRLDEVVLRALEAEPQRRYQHASEVKTDLTRIAPQWLASLPASASLFGYEYRSKRRLLGLPLVHIAYGMDPVTGRQRIARGVIAIGNIAIGWLAFGGLAVGGITFGGLGLGMMSIAGVAIGGLLAVGGMALGGMALGGMALGLIAVGGEAIGQFALGGNVHGLHVDGGNVSDPAVRTFFLTQIAPVPRVLAGLGLAILATLVTCGLLTWAACRHRSTRVEIPGVIR